MFKFWYEKLAMRFSFGVAFLAFLGVFVYAYFTEITIKSVGETVPFSETLVADGTNITADVKTLQKKITPTDQKEDMGLSKRNLTNTELQNWVTMSVSEALTFDKSSFISNLRKVRPYFTDSGLLEYQTFLKSSGLIDTIKINNNKVSIFLESPPVLLNGVEMEGVYRWAYRVPVTLTVSSARAEPQTKKLNLDIQLRRIKLDKNPNAVGIEKWTLVPGR